MRTASRAASSIVGLLISFDGGMPASRMIWRPSSAFVPSRRMTIGARSSTRREPFDDALGHLLAAGDAAEDVDEDRAHVLVVVDHVEGGGHHVGVGAAADVEEVGGLAADLVDDVERAHRQAGAVGDDADRCRRARCTAGPSPWPAARGRRAPRSPPYSSHSGWRNAALPSRLTLASRACDLAVGLEDQRVDLGQVAVALGEAAVQLDEDRRRRRRPPAPGSWRRRPPAGPSPR